MDACPAPGLWGGWPGGKGKGGEEGGEWSGACCAPMNGVVDEDVPLAWAGLVPFQTPPAPVHGHAHPQTQAGGGEQRRVARGTFCRLGFVLPLRGCSAPSKCSSILDAARHPPLPPPQHTHNHMHTPIHQPSFPTGLACWWWWWCASFGTHSPTLASPLSRVVVSRILLFSAAALVLPPASCVCIETDPYAASRGTFPLVVGGGEFE